MTRKRVAIIHEWLETYSGSERCLEQILSLYPEADLFSVVDFLPKDQRFFLHDKLPQTSFIQKLPFSHSNFRMYLPLMPYAVEKLDLSNYDLVLSSNHAVAKGVITGPDQLHISYIHSPIRYAWDMQSEYLKGKGLINGIKNHLTNILLSQLRTWDFRTTSNVDVLIANSNYIARKIWKIYRRKAKVIYPPVAIDKFIFSPVKEDFYLTASRLVPYKKIELIAEAFTKMPDKKLKIIGGGTELKNIKKYECQNISVLGYKPENELVNYMSRAKAFVFAAVEDFGIAPLEAQACGTPVIALHKGGTAETVIGINDKYPTGIFFEEQSVKAICNAIHLFDNQAGLINPMNCRKNAEKYSVEKFCHNYSSYIEKKWLEFQSNPFQA